MKICHRCGQEHKNVRQNKHFKLCAQKIRNNAIKNDPEKYKKHLEYHREKNKKYVRLRRNLPLDHPRLRNRDGEGTIHKEGYKIISIRNHPNAQKRGLILEHIYIMSQHLGRPLTKTETIHHRNGIRDDNRLENLELWDRKQPPGQRVEEKIAWCKEFLEQYGHTVIMKITNEQPREAI